LDSGSEVTLIPTSFIGNRKIQWTQRKIWAANGTEIPVKGSWWRRVVAESYVVIRARSQFDLSTRAVYGRLPQQREAEQQVWATEIKDGLFVASTLLPYRSTHLPVRVLNATEKPVVIRQGTLATSSVKWSGRDRINGGGAANKRGVHRRDGVKESITEEIKEQLRELLRKYSSVISLHELDLGWTDLVTQHWRCSSNPAASSTTSSCSPGGDRQANV